MKHFLILFLCLAGLTQIHAQGVRDWADFEHYSQANAELKKPAKVVFMGNSITRRWPETHPDFFKENEGYVGRGISGQVSAQMVMRFRQDVIDLKPQAVVIHPGTNDIALNALAMTVEKTFDNVKTMVELARAHKIKVVLCSTMPSSKFPWRPEVKPAEDIKRLNAMMKQYCKENKIVYVDYHSVMQDENGGLPEKYSEDGVHPNLEGYKVMEKILQKALKKIVK